MVHRVSDPYRRPRNRLIPGAGTTLCKVTPQSIFVRWSLLFPYMPCRQALLQSRAYDTGRYWIFGIKDNYTLKRKHHIMRFLSMAQVK